MMKTVGFGIKKIEKSNNLKVFGSKKIKGTKQNSQNSANVTYTRGRRTLVLAETRSGH
jgi:3-deoxy-D-manno-octulosonic-acid transferase